MNRLSARRMVDGVIAGLIAACVALAAIPVLVLLLFVVIKGVPGMLAPGFFTDLPHPIGVPGGGVFNAIVGTLIIVGIASLLAVPLRTLAWVFPSADRRN